VVLRSIYLEQGGLVEEMELQFRRPKRGGDGAKFEDRFGAYFPRAFAYAYSNLGDEPGACEVVSAALSQVFSERPGVDEECFRIELFTALRDICQARQRKIPLDIGLSASQREVITLTFDGGLTSSEVDQVLGTDTAALLLTSALCRLRETSSPSIIPSFYRLP